MISQMKNKVIWPALTAALLGVVFAGCSSTTTETDSTATDASTGSTATEKQGAGKAAPAELAAFFPGASLSAKAFPMNDAAAAHMSEEAGVKFSGKEGEWEVYEASQNGQRIGLAMMTHSDLPGGGDMHVAFAVDKSFKITKTSVSGVPDVAKMKTFAAQMVGKTHDAPFKVGKDLKATSGLAPQRAQTAADAVHRGLVILEENFNPAHSDHEAGHTEAGHTEGDGHNH